MTFTAAVIAAVVSSMAVAAAGHATTDRCPAFRDGSAGHSTPGTNAYPNGGMRWMAEASVADSGLWSAVIEPSGDHAYFATYDHPGQVIKVALPGLDPVGTIDLLSGENYPRGATIDPAGTHAYFANHSGPGRVVKIELASFTRVGALAMEPQYDFRCAVMDPAGAFAYFGAEGSSSAIAKVDLATFSPVGAIMLSPPGQDPYCAAMDPSGAFAYFGTFNSPGRVVIINLESFTQVASLPMAAGEDYLQSVVIDPDGRYAYFGTGAGPGKVVKFDLASFTRVGAISVPEYGLYCAVIAPGGAYAGFGAFDTPGHVVKIDLASFSCLGTCVIPGSAIDLTAAVIDPSGTYAYFAAWNYGGRIEKVAMSQKGFLKATRLTLTESGAIVDVRFYSHAAAGHVRLALYDDGEPKELLWESDSLENTAAQEELVVPIASGTPPSLILDPGTYWAAWQVDTTAAVASYTPGASGDGFFYPMSFGNAPAELAAGAITETDEVWTEYVTYAQPGTPSPTPTAVPPTATPSPTPTAAPPSPSPTSTPTLAFPLGVRIDMSSLHLQSGDEFMVTGYLDNPGPPLEYVPTFFVLDIFGQYYFWPSWVRFEPPHTGDIDYGLLDVVFGSTPVEVIPAFTWPDLGDEAVAGLRFWGAMLNQTMNDFMGEIAVAEWGYGP